MRSRLIDPQAVADALGVSTQTLANWRATRRGPRYFKVGSAVRYAPEDLEAWLDGRRRGEDRQAVAHR